jgi:hypothetical protein
MMAHIVTYSRKALMSAYFQKWLSIKKITDGIFFGSIATKNQLTNVRAYTHVHVHLSHNIYS